MLDLKVFISSYGIYNQGNSLGGKWWDVSEFDNLDDLEAAVKEDLAERGDFDPEIMCLDVDNDVFNIFQESGLNWLNDFFELVNDRSVGDYNEDAFIAYAKNHGSISSALSEFSDNFIGEMTIEDYARELLDEDSSIPEHIRFYIDYEKYSADLLADGAYIELDGFLFYS